MKNVIPFTTDSIFTKILDEMVYKEPKLPILGCESARKLVLRKEKG